VGERSGYLNKVAHSDRCADVRVTTAHECRRSRHTTYPVPEILMVGRTNRRPEMTPAWTLVRRPCLE